MTTNDDRAGERAPKIAPVQGYAAGIPWEMHLRAYDEYCKRHGEQFALIDLEGRNCRGGFHASELDQFIPGWRVELAMLTRLRALLEQMLNVAESADETGYVTDCGFVDLDKLHSEVRAALASCPVI